MNNVLIGQSGGPTAAINASLAGAYEAAVRLGAPKVYGMRFGIDGFLGGKVVDLADYLKTPADIELLKRTPSSFLGSCRYKLPDFAAGSEVYDRLFARFSELGIGCVIYIGGNDSMDTVKMLSTYAKKIGNGVRFVGVPKTIDNDLAITDHTPGFGSAAKYIAASIGEIRRDSTVYDLKSVTVVEIMGRNAGWLTAAAALAQTDTSLGADLIYLPEAVFDTDAFLIRVGELVRERGNIIAAVSEGIKNADGKYISESTTYSDKADSFGHSALGGTAARLSAMIVAKLGIKSRGIELSTLQRCASHICSLCDINEAYDAGAEGVRRAFAGESGIMIVFGRVSDFPYRIEMTGADIDKIANVERSVPADWILPDGQLDLQKVRRYMLPLIQGELPPQFCCGLPQHLSIEK